MAAILEDLVVAADPAEDLAVAVPALEEVLADTVKTSLNMTNNRQTC